LYGITYTFNYKYCFDKQQSQIMAFTRKDDEEVETGITECLTILVHFLLIQRKNKYRINPRNNKTILFEGYKQKLTSRVESDELNYEV
jgi:hypothetical protein